jgi:4-methyl-5(b-hydroxyethyl)-thiazole monophosphate biosynthesis
MSALVFLAPGFEDIEGITVIDILRRAEIETVVASLAPNPISAARHTKHFADVRLEEVDPKRRFEVVVLPGGAEGAKHLAGSALVHGWLNAQRERDQWVAAVCAAPAALLDLGWLKPGQKVIAHPSVQAQFPSGQVQHDQRVVVDGKLITGLAAGAAMEWSFEIVRQLRGSDAVAKVNQGVRAVV